jgi:CRP/FNR family transcriptional regulator, cyclic AMP receptor protein
MQTVRFKAGDTILSQGEEGGSAFLIVDGAVAVTVGEGVNARTVGNLGQGEVFGEMSLLEPGPRSASVTAVTDTECLVTSYDDFISLIEKDPERAIEFMKTLVRRLRHMNELMAAIGPRKRTIREMFRDWQQTFEVDDAELSEDEKRRYNEMMLYGTMWL